MSDIISSFVRLIKLDIHQSIFPRTPFILHNRGNETAHKVSIQPFKLCRKAVLFPTIEVIPAGEKRDALPLSKRATVKWLTTIFFTS